MSCPEADFAVSDTESLDSGTTELFSCVSNFFRFLDMIEMAFP